MYNKIDDLGLGVGEGGLRLIAHDQSEPVETRSAELA
jgi:hypothetical protein